MGLGKLFTTPNLSGLFEDDESVAVTSVIQKAFVQVTEEGTEAAAASGTYYLITN